MIESLQDQQRIRQSCLEALNEVLETMFFELPVDQPSGAPPSASSRAAAASFTGEIDGRSLSGAFQVAVEPPMLSRLAQDFLGLDEMEPPDESQSANVLCELANMLCGSTLSRLEPEARLRIAPPRTVDLSPEPLAVSPQPAESNLTPRASAWIDTPLECGTLWVRLEVREDA
jgi:hypothetical protein